VSDDIGDTDFDDVIIDDITDGVAVDGKRFSVVDGSKSIDDDGPL